MYTHQDIHDRYRHNSERTEMFPIIVLDPPTQLQEET